MLVHALALLMVPLMLNPAIIKEDLAEMDGELDKLLSKLESMQVRYDKTLIDLEKKKALLDGAKATLKAAKQAIKDAGSPESQEEYYQMKQLNKDKMNAQKDVSHKTKQYNFVYKQEKKDFNELELLKAEISVKKKDIAALQKILPEAKDKQGKAKQFISIRLSQTCVMLNELTENSPCPMNRELVAMFDNTRQDVSGKFIEEEGKKDIYRERSKMQNHWNFYKAVPNWIVIAVDPDPKFEERSSVVYIHPRPLIIHDKWQTSLGENRTLTVYKDAKVFDSCLKASVGPDLDEINNVINQILRNCEDDSFGQTDLTVPGGIDKTWNNYMNWLAANFS